MEFNFDLKNDPKKSLANFGKDMIEMAANHEIDPIIGRDDEIRRIIRILSRKTKNNPVLVGEPGVGKTAIVEGLAQRIYNGNVPENLKNKKIIEITIGALIAGASFQGQFEKRIKSVLQEVEKSNGEIILFIDELHTLIGAGKNNQGGMDAAQILKPLLARGKIKMIGATTLDEYRKYIEKDSALERRVQKVFVNEPSQKESITIMRGLKERLENFHKVRIHDNALVAAVELSDRYISDRKLPDKAIDLVDEAASGIKIEMNSKPEELEKQEQKIAMLKMEKFALSKEKDQKSLFRLKKIKDDIKVKNEEISELKKQWEYEKNLIANVSNLKNKLEKTNILMNKLQGEGKYEEASIVMYKDLPNIKKQLERAEINLKNNSNNLVKEVVTEEEIADIISKWTQIPITKLLKSERNKLISLEKSLQIRVKGQSQAIKLVAEAILRSKANINDPHRPIGSFIFMGSTGVGKTELAKSLAIELFDSIKNMIRIDMSEYMEEHSISKLIGAPPGYVGYDEGGQLTEAIRTKPYSIILFDEIEKAHTKVLNVLLQILDEGILTDGKGKNINFKNTIIILTTNIGSTNITKNKDIVSNQLLQKYLSPEFINRIDEIIVFNSLDREVIKQITYNEIKNLKQRLKKQGYYISFDDSIINLIATEGYNPSFGARQINRYIKHKIETKLAKDIISLKIKKEQNYELIYKNKKIEYQVPKLN